MDRAYTIGVDFRTSSVRAVVADCADGRIVGGRAADNPSGEQGILLDPRDPHVARQNPADYAQGLRAAVVGALEAAARGAGFSRERVPCTCICYVW